MRKKEWGTKDLFYAHYYEALRRIFGNNEPQTLQEYLDRYAYCAAQIYTHETENPGDFSYNERISTCRTALTEMPLEIIQTFGDGQAALAQLLDKNEYDINYRIALSFLTDEEITANELERQRSKAVIKSYSLDPLFRYRKDAQLLSDELEGKYKRLPEELRQTLRLFGYYLFNGTISLKVIERDYLDFLKDHPTVFAEACCIYFNHLERDTYDGSKKCAQWILKKMQPEYELLIEPWELQKEQGDTFRNDLKRMVIEISEERFVPALLGKNYFPAMVDCAAGFLETTFAIWANTVQLDEKDRILNLPQVEYRVAQWIKYNVEENYKIEPPLEYWEVELL